MAMQGEKQSLVLRPEAEPSFLKKKFWNQLYPI